MSRVGIILIVAATFGVFYNGYLYVRFRQLKKLIEEESASAEELAPFLEYNSSLFWVSTALLPAGIYLVFNKESSWLSILGLVIGLYGVSSFIQSFRTIDTMNAIYNAGRDIDSLRSTLLFTRIFGSLCICIGIYLFI